ncbi:PQQ-like beta-propeller repeat protein [Streptomyces sp. SCA3-4]|uniref:outer membrane protein assembly factor BamB family protein n=1 Tax=Streptomyces sichuanensis TaxID=2871810 RepID=UPI001CE2D1D7|nr:PQQ-binding-like beta-propeller repeat protein [Streptomyces sichuanensis]MCA6091347.1 PQQ-like beta-propeller repeat protein [Streptomyces sichuanensis]
MSTNSNSSRPSRRALLLTATAGVLGAGGYAGWEALRDEDVAAPPQRRALWTFEAGLKFGLAGDGQSLYAVTDSPAGLLSLGAGEGRRRWSVRVNAEAWEAGPLTVADGTVYVAGRGGVVRAHRADDGEPVWSAGPLSTGTPDRPVVLGSTVCVHLQRNSDDDAPGAPGVLCALDTATGRTRWTAPASGIFRPLPRQRLLLARTGQLSDSPGDARPVGALDPLTGEARWQAPASASEETVAVAPDGGTVYLLDEQHRLCAYDTEAGKRRWRAPAMGGVITAAGDGGHVYVCTSRGDLAAYDARDGGLRWRRTVAKGYCRPVVTQRDGRLFVTSGEGFGSDSLFNVSGKRGYVLALSADTGRQLWRVDRMEACWSPPEVVGNDVIVTHDAAWWSYDARTGKPRWQLPGVSSVMDDPLVASDVLYGLSSRGVQALRL